MKTLLASLILLIFSMQVLPVEEIGKLLFKKALVEEIGDAEYSSDDSSPESNIKKDNDPYTYHKHYTQFSKWILANGINIALISTEQCAKQFIPDIPTPPPNCAW